MSIIPRNPTVGGELASERTGSGPPAAVSLDAGATAFASAIAPGPPTAAPPGEPIVDLAERRDKLAARFAELQWDLGGMMYEMAIRDHIRIEVLVRHAALLQDVDAELREVERILHMDETGAAGSCASCGAPHSGGAVYCWQCGQALLERVPSNEIGS